MKIGLSTYSLVGAFRDGRMDLPGIIRTIAEWGGEHVEVVPPVDFTENPELVQQVIDTAKECNIPLSSYTFGANFLCITEGEVLRDRTEAGRHIQRYQLSATDPFRPLRF